MKSRFSLPRLESLLGRALAHSDGLHLKKPGARDPRTRGKASKEKRQLASSILSRINRVRMTQTPTRKP